MLNPVMNRRVCDGADALARVLERPRSEVKKQELLTALEDGIRVIQSTDDLGDPALNRLAWNAMVVMQERTKQLDKELHG